MLSYLTIAANGNLITLPPDVETPIRVNIDSQPTLARGRVYEFALNGPGNSSTRSETEWEEHGTVATIAQPAIPSALTIISNVLDDGKTLTALGRDGSNLPISYSWVLASGSNPPSNVLFSSVDHVRKDKTMGEITLMTSPSNSVLSVYKGNETEPQYRQIRIGKAGATAYIMFRRSRYAVTSLTDFIPIRSKMGLIYMVKAHQAYREERFQDGQAYEQQAVKLAQEEQEQRHSYGGGQGGESATIRNLNINNRDSVIVADIFDEATQILGPVGDRKVFDRITEAVELLDGKANWDGKIGYVDITTNTNLQYVTLPRYIDSIIKMNVSGQPSIARSRWYEFHLNGPGDNWLPCDSWKDEGEVVPLQITTYAQQFVAVPDLSGDVSAVVRGFGLYLGKKIYTADGPSGALQEGFPIEVNMTGTIANSPGQLVDDLQRVSKSITSGYLKLLGRDSLGNNELVQGYYQPDETNPHYRRIWLGMTGSTVRIMYRKNTIKVSSLTDQLHIRSKTAILCALRSLEALRQGKMDEAMAMEVKAVQLISERNMIDNQNDLREIEFLDDNEGSGFVDF